MTTEPLTLDELRTLRDLLWRYAEIRPGRYPGTGPKRTNLPPLARRLARSVAMKVAHAERRLRNRS